MNYRHGAVAEFFASRKIAEKLKMRAKRGVYEVATDEQACLSLGFVVSQRICIYRLYLSSAPILVTVRMHLGTGGDDHCDHLGVLEPARCLGAVGWQGARGAHRREEAARRRRRLPLRRRLYLRRRL